MQERATMRGSNLAQPVRGTFLGIMAELSAGLRIIIADTERLRNLAKGDGEDFLAYLLEQALHEARAIAGGRGQEIPPAVPEELPENVAAMPRRRR